MTSTVDGSLTSEWEAIQNELKKKLSFENDDALNGQSPQLIGGIDISYFTDDTSRAYVTLVVLRAVNLPGKTAFEKLYCHSTFIPNITVPYVPSFLAFREIDHLVSEVKLLKSSVPALMPQVLLVDGNGRLHPRGFGSASHLGVLIDIPTIGVAKNPYLFMDDVKDKLTQKKNNQECNETLREVGDVSEVVDPASKEVLGVALKSARDAKNPIYVSIGHKVSLATAIRIVQNCCLYRIPEPVRQADLISRELVRNHVEDSN